MQALRLRRANKELLKHQSGFTFLELMVTIGVASILMALAVPSFQSLLASSKLTATTNTLVFSLQMARSEAIKRGTPTGVCTSNSSLDSDATCSAGSGYEGGWIAYVDDNNNGTRDGSEEIIMAVEERSSAFSIDPAPAFEDQVYFNESGNSTNNTGVPVSGDFDLAFAQSNEGRNVRIVATGRISTTVTTD